MSVHPTPKGKRGIRLKDQVSDTKLAGPESLLVSSIIAHADVQMRAGGLDESYVQELADVLETGAELPPIVVYRSAVPEGVSSIKPEGVIYVADGFHRLVAAKAAGVEKIAAEVRSGGIVDAKRCAMGANSTHGRRRTQEDLERAYRWAVAESFVEPGDTAAVAELLCVSQRWAREITRGAREQIRAEVDAAIGRLQAEGKTQKEIAAAVGVSERTVWARIQQTECVSQKRNSSEIAGDVSCQEEKSSETAARDEEGKLRQKQEWLRDTVEEAIKRDVLFLKGQKDAFSDQKPQGRPRDEAIRRLSMHGWTRLEIATETGISQAIIRKALAGEPTHDPKPQPDEQPGSETAPDEPPVRSCDLNDSMLDAAKRAYLNLTRRDAQRFRDWLAAHLEELNGGEPS